MKALASFYQRTFFQQVDSINIGLTRILYCLSLLGAYVYAIYFDNDGWEYLIKNGYYNKSVKYHLIEFAGLSLYNWLKYIFLFSLAMAILGLKTRLSLIVASVSYLFYEYPISSIFKPYLNNIAFFTLLILSCSPGIERFSLDRLIKEKKTSLPQLYSLTWPQRAAKLLLGMIYLNAFASKIINSGWSWAISGHYQGYHLQRFSLTQNAFAQWIVTSPNWVGNTMAITAALIEFAFIFSVFLPSKYDWAFVFLGLSMHLVIFFSMELNFFYIFTNTYIFLINWERIYHFFYKVET